MTIHHFPSCLIVAVSLLLASCGKKPVDMAWWEGEQERIELAQRLALNEFRLIHREGDATEELVEREHRNRDLRASIESLSIRRAALQEELESMERGMVAMRAEFLRNRREAVTGKTFEKFTAWDGRTYHEASISSVDDAGVTIRHADGSARLGYRDLNDDQRQMFGLDAELALAATVKERADAVEYERWIDDRVVANLEREAERERLAVASEQTEKNRNDFNSSRQVVAANVSPLSKPSSEVSSRYSSRRYNRYRSSTSYYYQVPVYRTPCVPSVTYLNRLPKDRKPNPYRVIR